MSNYTPNLRLTQPISGETGWGEKVNNGITALLDSAVSGLVTIALADADYTLSVANGANDESRSMFITLTGSLSTTRNVICPSVSKLYFVRNATNHAVNIKTATGTEVQVPVGKAMALQCDGQNVMSAIDYVPATSYGHIQSVASATWDISHSLNKYPSVTITDSAGDEVEGEVRYNGLNSVTVKFSAPFAGRAYLN